MQRIKILSIDGGGIKGIIPAIVLKEIQKRLRYMGVKKEFHQIFDMIAGTSTGGLIALALVTPIYGVDSDSIYSKKGGIKVDEIIKLYEKMGPSVFKGRKKVHNTVRQFMNSKYSGKEFKNLLNSVFSNCTINNSLTNVLVSSFDMNNMEPFFFKIRNKKGNDYYIKDAAYATSAVPTYFPAGNVRGLRYPYPRHCLIDGGIFSVNPTINAYVDARKLFPKADEYIIISLGTGIKKRGYTTSKVQKWGVFEWVAPWNDIPLLNATVEGQKISSAHMVKSLPNVKEFRLDVEINGKMGKMDDGSIQNIEYLKRKARNLINNYSGIIDEICMYLV